MKKELQIYESKTIQMANKIQQAKMLNPVINMSHLTVDELINKLSKIENKSLEVCIDVYWDFSIKEQQDFVLIETDKTASFHG